MYKTCQQTNKIHQGSVNAVIQIGNVKLMKKNEVLPWGIYALLTCLEME